MPILLWKCATPEIYGTTNHFQQEIKEQNCEVYLGAYLKNALYERKKLKKKKGFFQGDQLFFYPN